MALMTEITPLKVSDNLTSIDASAGTGKTHSLSGIAVEAMVKDDVAPRQIAIVTFTKAAAAELRSRVRERLSLVHRQLLAQDPLGEAIDPWLEACLADEVARLRLIRSAERAIEEIDLAEISTIDSFAAQMLRSVTGVSAPDVLGAASTTGSLLQDQVVRTEILRAAMDDTFEAATPKAFHRENIVKTLKELAQSRDAEVPFLETLPPGDVDAEIAINVAARQTILKGALKRYDALRDASGISTFEGVIDELSERVGDGSTLVSQLLRQRFELVLIDEFQDTDPQQWKIFRNAFLVDSSTKMVVVGDPKQAIFGFRGGDVATFVEATQEAKHQETLGVNWRSDAPLVDATAALLSGMNFGSAQIALTPISTPESHADQRIRFENQTATPLRLRALSQRLDADPAREAVFIDLADQVVELLDHASYNDVDGWRPLEPRDIAVLGKSRKDIINVLRYLRKVGVPAVNLRSGDLFETESINQWRVALELAAQPQSVRLIRRFAASWFVGLSPAAIDELDDDQLSALVIPLHVALKAGQKGGPSEMMRTLLKECEVLPRLLSIEGGERNIVDLEHCVDVLAGMAPEATGPTRILEVLIQAVADASDQDAGDLADERQQRSESEGRAVTVTTVHSAKGLQWPVVLLPTLTTSVNVNNPPRVYRSAESSQRYVEGADDLEWWTKEEYDARRTLRKVEVHNEAQRLTYVALTRAECLQIVWWWPQYKQYSKNSPLAKLLFDPVPELSSKKGKEPEDFLGRLASKVEEFGDQVSLAIFDPLKEPVRRYVARTDATRSDLAPAQLHDPIDRRWKRWSFSTIKQLSDDHVSLQNPEDRVIPGHDEGSTTEVELLEEAGETDESERTSWSMLGAGPTFGTCVHAIFEDLVGVPETDTNISEICQAAINRDGMDNAEGKVQGLSQAIDNVLRSPLGDQLGGKSLGELTHEQCRAELQFDLPFPTDHGVFSMDNVVALIGAHLAGAPQQFQTWIREFGIRATTADLVGELTGSIDLVLNTGTSEAPCFSVIDYKTNQLGVSRLDYSPDALAEAMVHHDYPFQGILYLVGLHRYLRWRMGEAYVPEKHLGGMGYLFVRGMGQLHDDGSASGVFTWRPPTVLIEELSDLFGAI